MAKNKKFVGEEFFIQQAIKKKLKESKEYRSASFGAGASALIAVIIVLSSINFKEFSFGTFGLITGGIYALATLISLLARTLIRRDLIKYGEIKGTTRILAPFMIVLCLSGNVFASAAGFMLIKKGNLEYTVGVYTCLVDVLMILVSATSLFKPYVLDTFFLGMGLLIGLLVIHIAGTFLACHFVYGNQADKKMIPVGIVLIVTAVSGNLLALVLGAMLISKARNKEKEISVSWIDIFKRLFRSEMAVFGLMFAVFIISIAVMAGLTIDYDFATKNNYDAILHSPCLQFPFGTDDYGRCVLTRVIFGTRVSLLAGVGATMFSLILGMIFGAIAGYYSKADNIVMRIMDVFLAIPGLLLPIAIVTAFGTSLVAIVVALGAGCVPRFARVVRASVMGMVNGEYVEASRACGAKNGTILRTHILPNCLAPTIVQGTILLATNIVAVSSLSYLGLGVAAHIPEWGNILKAGSTYLEQAPFLAIYPGIVVVVVVLSVNFLGDGFRDAMDPKLK